jgi:hypothetical protein
MLKLLVMLVLIVGIAIIGGVLEIKIHPDQLAAAPGRVLGFVTDKGTIEKARTLGVKLKRQTEQAVTKDDTQKFTLALGYMQSDADRLQDLTDEGGEAETVVPQAQLLSESVERVRSQGEKVSVDTLTSQHDISREAFAKAQASLARLDELRSAHADLQAQFERITTALHNSLQTGAVAGAKDTVTATPTAAPVKAVPLSF